MTRAYHLDAVSKHYGALAALDQINISIDKGERIALIGPSGCGKSTLLRLLSTQFFPDHGSVEINGKDVTEFSSAQLRAQRTQIALIPQHLALVSSLRVIHNVISGRMGKRSLLRTLTDLIHPRQQDVHEVHQLLQRVGIGEKLYHRTDSLSGGQQQRVAVARALFQHAQTLIADEPVSSVDPSRAHAMMRLITRLASEENLTLICSLHHLEYAREYFHRLIGLRHGRIVFDGSPHDFSSDDFAHLYALDNDEGES